jgi:tetratricopeptide (TPR) repeat protein
LSLASPTNRARRSGRSSTELIVGLIAFAFAFSAGAADRPNLGNRVHAIGIDLGNVENGIRRLEREVVNPVAQSRYYSIEKRLIDARVYYEMNNFPKAAVLYIDATENREFKNHPERVDVLFRLGFSLYKLKNYLAAKSYLDQVIAQGTGINHDKALRYLIEIGLSTRSGAGLEASVERVGRLAGRSAETQYAYGKGLYRLGRTQAALAAFGQIASASPLYMPAQYYAGVIYTDLDKLKMALAAFVRVTEAPKADGNKQIRELAHLGRGRIHLELKDFTAAIDAYQEIDRHSDHFHTALHEMTWAHVNNKEYGKALNALEILLLTVENEQLATRANILRGRLNMLLDRTELAVETYNDIVKQFAPLRKELDRFARQRGSITKYFQWLLRRHSEAFEVGTVLSDRASNWVRNDEQLREVIGLFDEMGIQQSDVKLSERIIKELDAALAAGNRVEIFPNLKNAFTRITVAENQLVALSQAAIDAKASLIRRFLPPSSQASYDRLGQQRRVLEVEFAKAPKTTQEFQQRTNSVQRRFGALRRESFLMETSLKQVNKELAAMEKWLDAARLGDKGRKLTPKQERRLVAELTKEKNRLHALYRELTKLKDQIDGERAGIGAGDPVSQNEGRLRELLLDLHAKQDAVLSPAESSARGKNAALVSQLRDHRKRIVGNVTRLGRLMGSIDDAVDTKVADYKRQVGAERTLVSTYRREVDAFGRDSGRIAAAIGVPLFRQAHRRLTDVVLEADLGLVDVAWKRKEKESQKILGLQIEQADQVQQLEKTMKAILEE